MNMIAHYLDSIEAQVCRDGFMTHTMRRHLSVLGRVAADDETGQRIERLVARYNMPYVGGGDLALRPVAGNA